MNRAAGQSLASLHVLILRQADRPEDALQRLQSTPLRQGLEALGVGSSVLDLSAAPPRVPWASHLVVHYNDEPAIRAAVKLRSLMDARIVCLCADVYRYNRYRELDTVTHLFLAPTALHVEVIRSAVSRPVAVLPEAVDPIALPPDGVETPVRPGNRVCWFGYPESFDKSLRFVLPDAIDRAGLDRARFGIITAPGKELLQGAVHMPFDAATFHARTADYSHALLSHFAYDLHVNTLIKSANKMITAIVRGMVPLASATPAYRALARRYGLQELCYRNADGLAAQFRRMDFAADAARFRLAEVRQDLLSRHSPRAVAKRFLELIV